MIRYTSFMKPMIDDFIKYQTASQCWSENPFGRNLKTFENHCLKNFPNQNKLTQEMVNSWCTQRDTELNKSYITRIKVVVLFLKYTNLRGLTNLTVPEFPKAEKITYIPHAFTKEELKNFFYACDNIEIKIKRKDVIANQIMIPVLFKLLYSTGMRTIEARLLKKENVDLKNGIISIENSKGYNQHYIALHESMKKVLINYESEISKIYPNRIYFFPNKKDSYHRKDWININFKKLWNKYNKSYAVPYDLRHNYAITNINNWVNTDINFTAQLYYLSKSMGHTTIESTKYYYSLVPVIADIFKNQVNRDFNTLVPEVNEDE